MARKRAITASSGLRPRTIKGQARYLGHVIFAFMVWDGLTGVRSGVPKHFDKMNPAAPADPVVEPVAADRGCLDKMASTIISRRRA